MVPIRAAKARAFELAPQSVPIYRVPENYGASAFVAKAEAVRHVGKHAGNRPPVEAAVSRIQRSGEGSQSDDPSGQAHA